MVRKIIISIFLLGLVSMSLTHQTQAADSITNYSFPSASLVNDGGTIYFIRGTTKIPFTNYQAFIGLGYSLTNVVNGNLANYTPVANYVISTATAAHPWGSWLLYQGTVYYSTKLGLVGIPSVEVFTSNGGIWKNVVKTNQYDIASFNSYPNVLLMTAGDSRVYTNNSSTDSTGQSTTIRAGQIININNTLFLVTHVGLYGFSSMDLLTSWGYSVNQVTTPNSAESALGQVGVVPTKKTGCTFVLDQLFGNCGTTTANPASTSNSTTNNTATNNSTSSNTTNNNTANSTSSGAVNITTTSIPSATVGQAYTASFNYTYDSTTYPNPYYVFSTLPTGLAVTSSSAINGQGFIAISGTPTKTGSFPITLSIQSGNPASASSVLKTQAYTLVVYQSVASCTAKPNTSTSVAGTNSIGSVIVESPNGGECWPYGSIHNINWSSSAVIDKVSIFFWQNESTLQPIANNIPNNHSYSWEVNIGNTTAVILGKIEIIGYQTGVGSVTDLSDAFFTVY